MENDHLGTDNMPVANTLPMVCHVLQRLENAHIKIWLFGGWAEELLQCCQRRCHRDIDLLYPANNFARVEEFMQHNTDICEIPDKRFPHKRAFILHGVMVEFFLVVTREHSYSTNFFGIYDYEWPADTFGAPVYAAGRKMHIASQAALQTYRANHAVIEQVRREFLSGSCAGLQ